MKKVLLVKDIEVEEKPFILDDFIQSTPSIESTNKVTKKELKQLADALGLTYDDKQIGFTKKIITAYLER